MRAAKEHARRGQQPLTRKRLGSLIHVRHQKRAFGSEGRAIAQAVRNPAGAGPSNNGLQSTGCALQGECVIEMIGATSLDVQEKPGVISQQRPCRASDRRYWRPLTHPIGRLQAQTGAQRSLATFPVVSAISQP